jgi:hypothetical protein
MRHFRNGGGAFLSNAASKNMKYIALERFSGGVAHELGGLSPALKTLIP